MNKVEKEENDLEIKNKLEKIYNFYPNKCYCFYELNIKEIRDLFNNNKFKNKILALIINYENDYQIIYFKYNSITIITSYNYNDIIYGIDYTFNIENNNSISFITCNNGFCQIKIFINGKKYLITNLLFIINNKENKRAKSIKLYFNDY